MLINIVSVAFVIGGILFFTAGTIGLIRFPDVRSQLHALTKADNLGLGMVLFGIALYAGSLSTFIILFIAWLMALGAASVSAQLLADAAKGGDS